MKYAFIETEKSNYSIVRLCDILSVGRSGFYAWRKRKPSRRSREKQRLLARIKDIYQESHRSYGSPRIHEQLLSEATIVGRHRVARYMQELGLHSQRAKRYKTVYEKRSEQQTRIHDNVLGRNFKATAPNTKWVSDFTFIRHKQGWMFLAIVLDLYSRAIVGWAMSDTPNQALVSDALEMAVQMRQPKSGLLLHSDQGAQYTSNAYLKQAKDYGFIVSMSRRGNCQDNAVAESFFHSIKIEWIRNHLYQNLGEAKHSLFKYIELFYNRKRLHSTIEYKAPFVYEALHAS